MIMDEYANYYATSAEGCLQNASNYPLLFLPVSLVRSEAGILHSESLIGYWL